jgi:uncharacterized membrane protein
MENLTAQTAQPMEARSVEASRGWAWISGGYDMVKKSPAVWIGTFVIWFVLYAVASLIPMGSVLTTLFGSVLTGGWMLGCKSADSGSELKVEHLFASFKSGDLGPLLLVSVFYLIGFLIVALIVGLLAGMSMLPLVFGKPDDVQFGAGLLLGILLLVALSIPLTMAIWFAPALVVFHKLPAMEAMKLSFAGCLRNVVPFLVYGLIVMGLAIVAAIPLMLGFLVLGPVLFASIYVSYKDIFGR